MRIPLLLPPFARHALLLVGLAVLAACAKPTPATRFQYHGLAFVAPAGWALDTTDLRTTDGVFTLICEKSGFNESGIVTLTCIEQPLSVAEGLEIFRQSMAENIIYKNADLQFQPARDTTLNGQPAQALAFRLSLLGVPHAGTLTCAASGGRLVSVMSQTADEDRPKNLPGFRSIEQSLTW